MKLSHRLRLITKDRGSNVFATSSIVKRIFSLVSFVVYFALICFALFHVSKFPKEITEIRAFVWIALMVIVCWYASRVSNINLHISFSTTFSSFAFALLMNAYVIVFVVMNVNVKPDSWEKLLDQYYWWLPILVLNGLWKLKFAIFEYKARPYFGIKKLLNFLTSAILTGVLVYGMWMVKKYAIHKEKFDMYDNMTFMGIALAAVGILMVLIFAIIEVFYFRRNIKGELRTKKIIKLWSALLEVGTVAVWFVYKTITSSHDSNFSIAWSVQEYVFGGIALALVVATLAVGFTKKEAGGASRVFLLVSTTSIITLFLIAYMFQIWWGVDMYANAVILFPSIAIILIANIIIEPKTPFLYSFVYQSLMSSLVLYALLLWGFESFETKGFDLPFNLDEVIFVPALLSSVVLEGIIVSSYWWTITRINKYSSKSFKVANQTKGAKHE